jgi:hypothetical protein
MLRVVSLACTLLLIAITPAALRSFAEGPFPGFTGGFKEPTCQQCHMGHDLNDPGGTLTLSGVPAQYDAGEPYTITVTMKKDGLEKGGFQLAARAATGPTAGRDAGTLEVTGADCQLVKSADKTVTYIQHSPAGTNASPPGSLTWKFRWIAPKSAAGPVQFDLAANASNNDASPMDDYIYTASSTAVARAPAAFFIR